MKWCAKCESIVEDSHTHNTHTVRANAYADRTWRKVSRIKLAKDPCCQCCLAKDPPETRPAQDVHHIQKVKDAPQLKYVLSNLLSLCKQCHTKYYTNKGL